MSEVNSIIRFLFLPSVGLFYHTVFFAIMKIVLLLISIAYYTLAERKIMAAVQRRKGPNVVGLYGLLQPLADGLKLLAKELLVPTSTNSRMFLFAPLLILILSLVSWAVIPGGLTSLHHSNVLWVKNNILWGSVANINYTLLFLLAISSFNVYSIIIAGWASNSKYAFLGALRSAAQMISYEVSIGLVILPVILLTGSLNFIKIVFSQMQTIWFIIPLLPCAIIFFISMLAETNRTPFDLTEAEAELVAGYNTEYSSIIFAMFFLAEYSNMILMSTIFAILFIGGWSAPLKIIEFIPGSIIYSSKIIILCFLFVLVRATFPRYRYDQLMNIGWKIFLPISLAYLVFASGILLAFHTVPFTYEITLLSLPLLFSRNANNCKINIFKNSWVPNVPTKLFKTLHFSTTPSQENLPSKKFNWKLFRRLAAISIAANTLLSLVAGYSLWVFVIRVLLSFVFIALFCSPLKARLDHISQEFNDYVSNKHKILKYDWVLLLLLSPYVLFYEKLAQYWVLLVIFYILFSVYIVIALLRIYYVYEKKNPWSFSDKTYAMCKECLKFTGSTITGLYVGTKIIYGPSARNTLVNEVACSFWPGAVKDESELYVTIFHALQSVDPDFKPEEHLMKKPWNVPGTEIKIMETSKWVDRPSIHNYLASKGWNISADWRLIDSETKQDISISHPTKK